MRLRPFLFALATSGLFAHSAGASDPARADALHKEGLEAFRRWDFDGARKAFREAYQLDPRPAYLLDMGLAELQGSRPAEGLTDMRRYFAMPESKAEDPQHLERMRALMHEAEAKTGHLVVRAPDGATVAVDGKPSEAPQGAPLDVMPGAHTLQVQAPGTEPISRSVEAHAGETLELRFDPPKAPELPAPLPPAPAPSASAEQPSGITTQPGAPPPSQAGRAIVSGTLVGVGAVGLILGGVFYANASSDNHKLDALSMQTGACPQPATTPDCQSLASTLNSRADNQRLGSGFVVAGTALAVAGVATWLVWPMLTKSKAAGAMPVLFAGGGGAALGGSF